MKSLNTVKVFILVTTVIQFGHVFVTCHQNSGLTIEVPDREEMCFYENFEGSRMYIFEFRVLRGGNYDIDVLVESPSGKEIYNQVRKTNDHIMFQISWGTFKFCFSNQFSTITHKIVYFEIRPEDHKPLAVEGGRKGPSANTQVEESMEVIHSMATKIMEHQMKYRLSEARGRNEADLLNEHVQTYSIIQAVIILVVGLGELFILKMFFTEKRPKDSATATATGSDSADPNVHRFSTVRP
ncbi:hypothetical protein HELRODRAFT_159966 [Helobdella robusta]|uniref:GOLD domain-containing protein n=1 Tax=Helobdella robusta TaxID=6412 RepID=T1EPL8_HELRO|nr:hypothetical protein HELRODRAFT_159966 [Helobdella robusta]ESO05884.1 hypothetical protein HELRODRAFT_159966 [Helobdella robusta]